MIWILIVRYVDREDVIEENILFVQVFHHHLKDVMIGNVGDYVVE
jgi:hypothetical protein